MTKNIHLEHPEDSILDGTLSVLGAFLNVIRLSVKIDGAPAIVWGTNPATGNFFDDVGIPDHMDQEAYDSLQQKFFANVPAWLLQKRQHHLQHLHVGGMTKITSTSKVGVFLYNLNYFRVYLQSKA